MWVVRTILWKPLAGVWLVIVMVSGLACSSTGWDEYMEAGF